MSLKVVEQLEAAIQGGSVDVQVEIVARDGDDDAPRFAQVAVTQDDGEELDLRVLAAMSPTGTKPGEGER